MVAKLFVISDRGQRLTLQPHPFALSAIDAAGDDYTSLVLQKDPIRKAGDPPPPPPPKPDIGVSFMAGLPAEISLQEVINAEKVAGPVSFDDLAKRFDTMGVDEHKVIFVNPQNGV